jgi:hypothetical protein
MAFVNLQVNLADLPAVRELEMEPMSPDYIREVKTQLLIIWPPLLLVAFIPSVLSGQVILLAIPALLLLLALLISTLVIKKARIKGIALRDHDIASRSGLFWRKTILLAFDRVQHVEVSSGPLQRKYGLASLKFFTAGGSGVDLKIEGLQRQRAEQIRAYVLGKSVDKTAA